MCACKYTLSFFLHSTLATDTPSPLNLNSVKANGIKRTPFPHPSLQPPVFGSANTHISVQPPPIPSHLSPRTSPPPHIYLLAPLSSPQMPRSTTLAPSAWQAPTSIARFESRTVPLNIQVKVSIDFPNFSMTSFTPIFSIMSFSQLFTLGREPTGASALANSSPVDAIAMTACSIGRGVIGARASARLACSHLHSREGGRVGGRV